MATDMSDEMVRWNNVQRVTVKERFMGIEYFLLIALGSLIVGLMSG